MPFALAISMLFAIVAAGQVAPPEPPSSAFGNSYVVWTQGNDSSCLYIVGDIYVERSKLERALRTESQKSRGVELVVDTTTPAKCASYFSTAAVKAGFTHLRTRLATDRDRNAVAP